MMCVCVCSGPCTAFLATAFLAAAGSCALQRHHVVAAARMQAQQEDTGPQRTLQSLLGATAPVAKLGVSADAAASWALNR